MRFAQPNNPKTGKAAIGTCDLVPGVAIIRFDPDGSAEYCGQTRMDWDGQQTVSDRSGQVQLIDDDGNTWFSELLPGNGPSSRAAAESGGRTFVLPGLTLTQPLRPIGEGKDPNARLLGRLDLLGASFHVEADQVVDVPSDDPGDPHGVSQRPVLPDEQSHYPELFNLAGGGEPLETVKIPGLPRRRYVVYIYPFCL